MVSTGDDTNGSTPLRRPSRVSQHLGQQQRRGRGDDDEPTKAEKLERPSHIKRATFIPDKPHAYNKEPGWIEWWSIWASEHIQCLLFKAITTERIATTKKTIDDGLGPVQVNHLEAVPAPRVPLESIVLQTSKGVGGHFIFHIHVVHLEQSTMVTMTNTMSKTTKTTHNLESIDILVQA